MSGYIRDDGINALYEQADDDGWWVATASELGTLINSFCAADVAPVVHGTWLLRESKCSVCGDIPEYEYDIRPFKYCPNCGAKMDIEDEQFWKEMHDER